MYKALLILRYLRRKLAPLFAAGAVVLCTAMVIIVSSVMGGFLDTWRQAARRVTADITVRGDFTGFPFYDQLVEELEAAPQIAAATAIIQSAGLVKVDDFNEPAPLVLGIRPEELDRVLPFRETLHWQEFDLHQRAMRFDVPEPWIPDDAAGRRIDGAVAGIALFNRRFGTEYDINYGVVGRHMAITVFPITRGGSVQEPRTGEFLGLNESKSDMYEFDRSQIFLPFDRLQEMMGMEPASRADPQTGEIVGESPGRASAVLVRGAEGVPLPDVQRAVDQISRTLQQQHPEIGPLTTITWEQQHAQILTAVQNEKGMVTFLLGVISLVAVVMIATTFYMIVLEKTRDIGVLRALGASRMGIANIFLGYGVVIGVIGAGLGVALGAAIVFNLNDIEAVIYQFSGWRMWNPETYIFDRIPERVDWNEAAIIAIGAILSSLGGALIPATLAARLDPVESLRYE